MTEPHPGAEACWVCGGLGVVACTDFGEVSWATTETPPEDCEWCWQCQGEDK